MKKSIIEISHSYQYCLHDGPGCAIFFVDVINIEQACEFWNADENLSPKNCKQACVTFISEVANILG